MKTTLSAIALAAAVTLTPFIGGSFAVADDSAQRDEHGGRFTPEDRAAFLDARIAALKRGAGTRYWLNTTDDDRALSVCRAQPGIDDVRVESGRISFTADESAVGGLSQALVESGALIHAMAPQTVTLEDLFFSYTEGDGPIDPAPTAGPPPPGEPAQAAR